MIIVSYYICQSCVQCSILALYLRLGIGTTRSNHMLRIIHILMGFSVLNNTIGACLGLTFSFVTTLALQSAQYTIPLWFAYGTINLLLDLTIWSLPLPAVFSVMKSVSTRKKIGLVLVFSLGMGCLCSAILRVSLVKHLTDLGADPTYRGVILDVLYIVEPAVAISCASLATLRPLVVKVTKGFNRLRGKPTSTDTGMPTGSEFEESPDHNQPIPNGYESRRTRRGGSKSAGSKGGSGDTTTAGEELMEWRDDVSDIGRSRFVQQTCGCSYRDGGAHTSSCSCTARLDAAPGAHIQGSAPTPTEPGNTYRSSSASSGETLGTTNPHHGGHSRPPLLPASESTVNLTNADSNTTTD